MNEMQKDTLRYIRNGLLQLAAIIAFGYIFGQAVEEWNTPAEAAEPESVPECTACGCNTPTKSVDLTVSAL